MALTGPFAIIFSPIAILLMVKKVKNEKSGAFKFLFPVVTFFLALIAQAAKMYCDPHSSVSACPISWVQRVFFNLFGQLFFLAPFNSLFLGKICTVVLAVMLLLSIIFSGRKLVVPTLLTLWGLGFWALGVLRINNALIQQVLLAAGLAIILFRQSCWHGVSFFVSMGLLGL